jgi:hypothetical protein
MKYFLLILLRSTISYLPDETLSDVTKEDMKEMGILKIGHRLAIISLINDLVGSSGEVGQVKVAVGG